MNTLANMSGNLDVFWTDRSFASAIVKFRDRVEQVQDFFEKCRRSLSMVWNTLFSMNAAPQTLLELLGRYKNVAEVQGLVRSQMMAGAKVALSFALAWYPNLDLVKIGRGPPSGPGGVPMELEYHYALADDPAKEIALKIEMETDNAILTQAQGGGIGLR